LTNVIARLYMDDGGAVRGITFGPKLESSLLALFSPRNNPQPGNHLTPDTLAMLLRDLDAMTSGSGAGRPIPLLTSPNLRVGVRRLIEPVLPNLPVVSLAELPSYVKL